MWWLGGASTSGWRKSARAGSFKGEKGGGDAGQGAWWGRFLTVFLKRYISKFSR